VTIYKGIDPRDYTLLCYGSAGGQHISAVAAELGITDIAVPVMPGAFSAFGLICSDLKVDLTRSVVREFDRISNDELTALFTEMEAEGIASVQSQGVARADIVVERFIEAHHVGQTWETVSRAPTGVFDDARRAELLEEFHRTHERLWAFRAEDIPLVVVNVRVAVVGPVEKPALPRLPKGNGKPSSDAVLFERQIHLGGDFRTIPFLRREALRTGDTIEGPAAVVEQTSTTLLMEGDRCVVHESGTLRIRKENLTR
jgi:N-methylhydantoinase A